MRALQYTFWILAVAVIARTLAPIPTEAANKDTELILAELRQLQAQVSQLQRAQNEIERMVKLLASRSDEDSVQQIPHQRFAHGHVRIGDHFAAGEHFEPALTCQWP